MAINANFDPSLDVMYDWKRILEKEGKDNCTKTCYNILETSCSILTGVYISRPVNNFNFCDRRLRLRVVTLHYVLSLTDE
jgi:hypothetical protein